MGRCLQRLIGHSCGRLTHEKLLDLQSSTRSLSLPERSPCSFLQKRVYRPTPLTGKQAGFGRC
jgi:hypothetical protein